MTRADSRCDVMLESGNRCPNVATIVAIIDPFGPDPRTERWPEWFGNCSFCDEHMNSYQAFKRHPESKGDSR